jgi:hypothetical protein
MKRLTFLAALLVAGVVGCTTDNRTSIEILGRAAPSSATECTFAPGGEYRLGNGLYDVALGGQYNVVLYVQNNLVDPKTLNSSASTEANAWTVESVQVRVNPSDYTGEYHPSPALASVSGVAVLPVAGSPIVEPAGGQGTIWTGLLSSGLVTSLQGVTTTGNVVLGVTLQGRTNDDKRLDTDEWIFPLQVCNGCVTVPTSCPTGKTLTGACDGQSTVATCQ